MRKFKIRNIIAVIITGFWINISEFFRNEFLLKKFWVRHYQSLELTFPSSPINGMMWTVWGFLFAVAICVISKKYNLVQTALLSWFLAFVLMWIVVWNLHVLPVAILVYALPLSLLEVFIGSYICRKISPTS